MTLSQLTTLQIIKRSICQLHNSPAPWIKDFNARPDAPKLRKEAEDRLDRIIEADRGDLAYQIIGEYRKKNIIAALRLINELDI